MLGFWSAPISTPTPPAHPFLSLHLSNSRKPSPISNPPVLPAGPAVAGGRFLPGPSDLVNQFFTRRQNPLTGPFHHAKPSGSSQREAGSKPPIQPCQSAFYPKINPRRPGRPHHAKPCGPSRREAGFYAYPPPSSTLHFRKVTTDIGMTGSAPSPRCLGLPWHGPDCDNRHHIQYEERDPWAATSQPNLSAA